MEPATLVAIAGLAVLALRKKPSSGYELTQDWEVEIDALASELESRGILPGFSRFLIPSAWIESRGNPQAGSSARNNAARGWFGMRPQSAFNWRNNLEHLASSDPNLLKDPRWAVATAADYVRRLIQFNSGEGQVVRWADIRRGWKYPWMTNIYKVDREQIDRNLKQFERGIHNTTQDYAISDEIVELGDWPGIDAVLGWLGVTRSIAATLPRYMRAA